MYTVFQSLTPAQIEAVKKCAKGKYQRALLDGRQRWSGADLQGKAKHWSMVYSTRRANLLERIRKAGFTVEFRTVNRIKTAVIRRDEK